MFFRFLFELNNKNWNKCLCGHAYGDSAGGLIIYFGHVWIIHPLQQMTDMHLSNARFGNNKVWYTFGMGFG